MCVWAPTAYRRSISVLHIPEKQEDIQSGDGQGRQHGKRELDTWSQYWETRAYLYFFLRIGNQTELSCHRWCQLQEDQFDVDQVSDEDFNPGHTSAVTDAVKVSQNLRVHTSHSSLTQNMFSGWNNLTIVPQKRVQYVASGWTFHLISSNWGE